MLNNLENPPRMVFSALRFLYLCSYTENMFQLKSNTVKTHQEIHSMDVWHTVHAPHAQITKNMKHYRQQQQQQQQKSN